jgi:hypothetical protein
MDSGILMIQDSILVCSPDPSIPHTAPRGVLLSFDNEILSDFDHIMHVCDGDPHCSKGAKRSRLVLTAPFFGTSSIMEGLAAFRTVLALL